MMQTRNLEILAMEMSEVYWYISPPIFCENFHQCGINYNSRINSEFVIPNLRSAFYGRESTLYLGPKIWDIVPLVLKELITAVAFKKGIKRWNLKDCPCTLCKKSVSNLGFITVPSRAFLKFLCCSKGVLYLKISVNFFVKIFFILYGWH